MNCYWAYPWPVEIVTEESIWTWLGPVLAFVGTILLFAGSLIVMRLTNNAADRRAADDRQNQRERDFRLFQRDKLLNLGDQVIEAAIETWDQLVKIRNSPDPLSDGAFREVDTWGRKVAANVVRLQLIGAHETSERCITLRDAINSRELRKTIIELDTVERTTIPAQLYGTEANRIARQQELRTKFAELMGQLNDARKAFSDSVERELARTS